MLAFIMLDEVKGNNSEKSAYAELRFRMQMSFRNRLWMGDVSGLMMVPMNIYLYCWPLLYLRQ